MTALEIARLSLGITQDTGLLVDRLKMFIDRADAEVYELTDMTEERLNEMSDKRKTFYESTIADVAMCMWNTASKNGIQSQTDGTTNTVYLTDLPESVRKKIGRFRCRI